MRNRSLNPQEALMADYTLVVALALVTLSVGVAFAAYQANRARRAQRESHSSAFARPRDDA